MHKLKDVHWSQKHTTSLNILPVQVQFFFFNITKNNISGVYFIIYTYEQLFFFFFFFFLSLFLHLMWTDYQSVSPDIKCLGDFGLPPIKLCIDQCTLTRHSLVSHSSQRERGRRRGGEVKGLGGGGGRCVCASGGLHHSFTALKTHLFILAGELMQLCVMCACTGMCVWSEWSTLPYVCLIICCYIARGWRVGAVCILLVWMSLGSLVCESPHVHTVCIWRCEHTRFCVKTFMYRIYIFIHSFNNIPVVWKAGKHHTPNLLSRNVGVYLYKYIF